MHRVRRTLIQKSIFTFLIACVVLSSSIVSSQADELSKLRKLSLEAVGDDFKINFEHSKSPVLFELKSVENPPKLLISIQGAKITFTEYENKQISIPVDKNGVKSILLQERTDYRNNPAEFIAIQVEMSQNFTYKVDSQWGDQFVTVTILPAGKPFIANSWGNEGRVSDPFKKIESIRKIKDKQAQEARDRLDKFTQEKRRENAEKDTVSRLLKLRKNAKERVESGKTLEEAYKKLKADTQSSNLPIIREQIAEQLLYRDVSMPSQNQPIVRIPKVITEIRNLDDCLTIAMNNHLPIQIAQEQKKLAKLRVREARRSFYPSFLGQWKETDGKTITEPYRGRSYGLQAEQPLFTGGRLVATLRKEQLGELIAQGNLDRTKQNVIFGVNKAYYELISAKRVNDLMNELIERETKLLNQVEKEFKIGSATPAVMLTAQSLYNQVCFQGTSMNREFALAKLRLEKAMLTENLDIENLNYNLRHRQLKATLEECLDIAFRSRPELRIIEHTIKAAKYGEDIIRSEEFPNISLVSTYGRSGEAFSQRELTLAKEWTLMGQVKWFLGGNTLESSYTRDQVTPFKVTKTDQNLKSQSFDTKFSFWDNLAHFSKIKEAHITRKQAEKDLAEMRNKIKEDTEDAYYSFIRYQSQFGFSLNEIGFRRKQLEIAKAKRRMNEANAAEVMEAEFQLVQSNSNYEQAISAMNASIVSLNRAICIVDYFKD